MSPNIRSGSCVYSTWFLIRMMKCTEVNLQLLSDYDMLLMIKKGVRRGLVQASMKYAKANNEHTEDFHHKKPKSWMIYQDFRTLRIYF